MVPYARGRSIPSVSGSESRTCRSCRAGNPRQMPTGSNGFSEMGRLAVSPRPIMRDSRRCSSTLGPRYTWRALPRRWPKGSGARAKSSRRALRVRPSTGCARRRLVFPDDADDHSLHDDVALVEAERLQVLIGRLQPDPPARFPVETLDRGALSMDQRDHRLAGVGLVPLLDHDVIAILDVLVDHRVPANLQDVAASASREQLVWDRDGFVAGHGLDWRSRRDESQQRQLRRAGLALGWNDLDRAALVMRPPDVPFALEVGEVFVHGGQRLEPELAGDLLEARSVPLFFDVFRDVIEDLALAPRDRHAGSRRFTEP